MDEGEMRGIVEALLFASDKPITFKEMETVIEEAGRDAILRAIEELKEEYRREGRSFQVVEVAGGFQLTTLPQFAPWLNKFYTSRRRERFSQAAMETLSIVAYKQPIVRAEIESIRGVDVAGVLHNLLERKLIRVVGRKKVLGRPLLYGTTNEFLEHFGLKSLSELPKIEELKDGEGTRLKEVEKGDRQDRLGATEAHEQEGQESPRDRQG